MTRTLALLTTLALSPAFELQASPVAYVNATLHPIASPAIENGVLLVDEGRIVALGAGLTLPAGAQLVDLGGRHVWPGLIDAATDLGLAEIGAVRATDDTLEIGDLNSDLRVEVAFHPDSRRILPAVAGGVLTAHVVPNSDLFAGSSAAMRLDGWTWEEMTLRSSLGQHLRFPVMNRPTASYYGPAPSEEEFEKKKKEQLRRLDEIVGAARGYDRARVAALTGTGPAVDLDPKYEALRPLLAGTQPLFVWAEERNQIEAALDWAKKHGFTRVVLVSSPDAAYFAERLATAKVPVLLHGVHRLPERSWEPYDAPFTAAARLHAAGVSLAFTEGGDSSNARNLPFQAATAVAYGLPREVAHVALTKGAAEILGIADRVGALAPGLDATFFVATGDPLEIQTRIERSFVAGVEVDLQRDPQWQLWERYRNRPAPAPR